MDNALGMQVVNGTRQLPHDGRHSLFAQLLALPDGLEQLPALQQLLHDVTIFLRVESNQLTGQIRPAKSENNSTAV